MTSAGSATPPADTSAEAGRGGLFQALLVGIAVAGLHVAFGPNILATLGTLYDDIVYLTLGKALAGGEGYRSIHLVGSPVHVKFPPLLPVAYSVLWRLTGSLTGAVYGAYALSMLALAGGAAALWAYGRALGIRWWLLAFFALGPLLLLRTVRYFAGAVSEPWFLLGWAVSLLLVSRLGTKREGAPDDRVALLPGALANLAPSVTPRRAPGMAPGLASGLKLGLILGLVLAATVLARTQAVVVIPAVLIALLLRRLQPRVIGIVAVAAVAPIAIWRWVHGRMMAAGPLSPSLDQSSYMEWVLGDSLGETLTYLEVAARTNPANYLLHAAIMLVGWSSWKAQTVVLVAVALALLGIFWSARKRPELALSVIAVSAVLVFWPFNQARFLTTLLPFAGLAAAFAVERIYRSVPKPLQRASVVGCALLALALAVVNAGIRSNTYAYQASEGSLPVGISVATAWIESNTGADDYVLADYSAVYFLRTGRQTSIGFPEQPFTVPSALIPAGRYLARQLLADSADYLVDARPSEGRLGPQIRSVTERCPGVLQPLEPIPTDELAPRYYGVTRDESCLAELATQVSPLERVLTPTE